MPEPAMDFATRALKHGVSGPVGDVKRNGVAHAMLAIERGRAKETWYKKSEASMQGQNTSVQLTALACHGERSG